MPGPVPPQYHAAGQSCGKHRAPIWRLERRDLMEKVIVPTLGGFMALMSLWVLVAAFV